MSTDPAAEAPSPHGEATIRALRAEEREACLDLWCTVWPGENSRAYFRRYFYGDVDWLPYYTQVAEIEGRLVSAVHICRRVVACGDLQLTMGGIANVATDPEFRGHGYSSACLRSAVAVMEADAMDFSLLFTGINGFYAREGFADWPREQARGTLRADVVSHPTAVQVRPATDADLPAIEMLYSAANRTRPIAVQRTSAYWRDWVRLTPDTMADPPLLAGDETERPVGYVCYRVRTDDIVITEIGIASDTDPSAAMTALLEAVVQRALDSGKQALLLNPGLRALVGPSLDGLMAQTESSVTVSGMVRLLHRDSLLRSLIPELTDRWSTSGRPAGIVTFSTPYGLTELNATGPFLRVNAVDAAETVLPQAALLGLLFGSLSPEAATAETALHPLLHALFPAYGTVYWSADGF